MSALEGLTTESSCELVKGQLHMFVLERSLGLLRCPPIERPQPMDRLIRAFDQVKLVCPLDSGRDLFPPRPDEGSVWAVVASQRDGVAVLHAAEVSVRLGLDRIFW